MPIFNKSLNPLFFLSLLFLLSACSGWHLRQENLSSPLFHSLTINSSKPYSNLTKAIKLSLQQIGYSIKPKTAFILNIFDEKLNKTAYTYDNKGILQENYLVYSLTFSLTTTTKKIILPKQTLISSTFSYYNPNTLLISNNNIQTTLSNLRKGCITKLMYKLATIHLPKKTT